MEEDKPKIPNTPPKPPAKPAPPEAAPQESETVKSPITTPEGARGKAGFFKETPKGREYWLNERAKGESYISYREEEDGVLNFNKWGKKTKKEFYNHDVGYYDDRSEKNEMVRRTDKEGDPIPLEGVKPKPAPIQKTPVETAKPAELAEDLGTLIAPGAEGKTAYSVYEFKALSTDGKPKVGRINALDRMGAYEYLNLKGLNDPEPGSGKPWIKLETVKVDLPAGVVTETSKSGKDPKKETVTISREIILANLPEKLRNWQEVKDWQGDFVWDNRGTLKFFDKDDKHGKDRKWLVPNSPKSGEHTIHYYTGTFSSAGKKIFDDDGNVIKTFDKDGKEISGAENKSSESAASATSLENLEIGAVELEEVKAILMDFLDGQKNVDHIDHLEITAAENNELSLDAKLTAKKAIFKTDVVLKAHLKNHEDSIKVDENYFLTATKMEDTVKGIFAKKIDSIAEEIKKGIEKSRGRKVMMMVIMNGKLIVGYEKPKAKPIGEPTIPIPAPILRAEEESPRAKTERPEVANLRALIETAKKQLEANRVAREQDDILIADLRRQLAEAKAREEREEIERPERERKEKIEKDREKNPFKWFLIEEMSDPAFRILFAKEKDKVSLEEVNRIFGETGREVNTTIYFESITPLKNNILKLTSNGFCLQLQNAGEVRTEKGLETQGPKARYKLITPQWKYARETDGKEVNYEEGMELMVKRAKEYQEEQFKKFDENRKK